MELNKLKENPDNPRTIDADALFKLKNSIDEFPKMMKLRPLIVDNKNMILGGNMRLKALRELGFKEIPDEWIKRAEELTDDEKKRFIIADNVSGGAWDFELLAADWDTEILNAWGLEMSDGFMADINDELQAVEDNFILPDEVKTDIKTGDLIEIGLHRLLCQDVKNKKEVEKFIKGEKFNLLTDPPYGIQANKQTLGTGKKEFYRGENWDKKTPNYYYILPMVDKTIIWGGNYFAHKLPVTNNWLCWHKKNDERSFSEFELAWSNLGLNCRIFSNHWGGEEKLHPTMKPILLMDWCIKFFDSKPIFDPFIGSGSTMVGGHQLNRVVYGMDNDPKYCQITINRMLKLEPDIDIKINGKKYINVTNITV